MLSKMRVPYYSVIFLLSVHLLINPHHSSASSHWVVTEEGKIQAQVQSQGIIPHVLGCNPSDPREQTTNTFILIRVTFIL